MKKISSFALFTALCVLPIAHSSAAWQELGSNALMVVYVDLDTVSAVGEKAQIMSMLDFKKPGVNPKTKQPVSSIIGINEYNCPAVSYRPIEYKVFSGNKGEGKVIADIKSPDSQFEAITNGSWAAGVYSIACRAK